ncbi:MAG: hypothetical protein ABH804_00825 [archaeon]
MGNNIKKIFKNRRGSHVGVILSFVIFITFLVFLYSTIEPVIKIQRDKKPVLDFSKIELIEMFSGEVTRIVIGFEEGTVKSCIKITQPPELSEGGLRVTDNYENTIDYSLQKMENSLYFKVIEPTSKIYIVYSSQYFDLRQLTLVGCDNKDYNVISEKTQQYILDSKIANITNYVNSGNYEAFKEELGIPFGNEIGFNFTYSNGTSIGTTDEITSTGIYSEEFLIQYMDNGKVLSGILIIRVW